MSKKDEFGIDAFEEIVARLWENRNQLKDPGYYFDYPEYGGLPARIADKLPSHAVDIIQEIYNPYNMKSIKRKSTFRNMLKENLFVLAS